MLTKKIFGLEPKAYIKLSILFFAIFSVSTLHFWGFVVRLNESLYSVVDTTFFVQINFIFLGNLTLFFITARFFDIFLRMMLSVFEFVLSPFRVWFFIERIGKKLPTRKILFLYYFIVGIFFLRRYIGQELLHKLFNRVATVIFQFYEKFLESLTFKLEVLGWIVLTMLLTALMVKAKRKNKEKHLRFDEKMSLLMISIAVLLALYASLIVGGLRAEYVMSRKLDTIYVNDCYFLGNVVGHTQHGFIVFTNQLEQAVFFSADSVEAISAVQFNNVDIVPCFGLNNNES